MSAVRPPAKVLLVDDLPELRALLRDAIERHGGFEVVGEASSGTAAVDLVRGLVPDFVLLDLALPDIAGRDVLTRILSERPATKVVIFSSVDPDDRLWYEERAEALVRKDVDSDYLAELLGSLADEHVEAEVAQPLPQDLRSVRDARHFVASTLDQWGVADVCDEAFVVVTELASNAVLHAGTPYEVRLALTPQSVRIEVADEGPGTPEPRPPTPGGVSGRGLFMVAALSVSWGVDTGSDGHKVVWSELARPDARSAS